MRNEMQMAIKKLLFSIFLFASSAALWFACENLVQNFVLDKWTISSIFIVASCMLGGGMLLHIAKIKGERWEIPVIIVLCSLGVHSVIILLGGENTVQTSDLLRAIEASKDELSNYSEWFCTFSSWTIVPVYYKVIGFFLGTRELVLKGIYLNCLYKTFTALNIYLIVYFAGNRKRIGFIAAMLYVFWPMHLIYSICPTPENINIWLISLAILMYECAWLKSKKKDKGSGILMIGASIILSLSGFFKSVDKLVIIVFICMGIMYFLEFGWGGIKKYLIVIGICFVTYVGTTHGIYEGLEIVYDAEINKNIAPHYLYIGLSPENGDNIVGIHTKENGIYYDVVEKDNYDYEKANSEIIHKLISQIRDKGITIRDFINKFELTWGEASYLTWPMYALSKDNIEILNRKYIASGFSSLVKISYIVILVYMILGIVRIFRKS